LIHYGIKSRCGDVFKGEPAVTIPALEKMRLAPAQGTLAVV
jgi:hypothetical protein